MSKVIKSSCMQEVAVVIGSKVVVDAVQIDPAVANDLLNSANHEAAAIIAQAKMAAEQCLSEATQQIAPIKQQAYDDGYQKGYQEGIVQGQQEGLAGVEQVMDQAIIKAQQLLAITQQEVIEMTLASEEQIVELALAVARKIIAYEIAENPMVILPLVKAALQKVIDQEEIVIRVGIDDFDTVLQAKKELQTMVGSEQALKIIVDRTIENGSCVIDTSYGTVDARIDSQFETIKKALQGVA